MKLITEAALDDQFNVQIGKIQDAIEKLEALTQAFMKEQHWTTLSQVRALDRAQNDIQKLADHFSALRW